MDACWIQCSGVVFATSVTVPSGDTAGTCLVEKGMRLGMCRPLRRPLPMQSEAQTHFHWATI